MTPVFNFNVSVIIPVYNAEQYIRRAVKSVLDQDEVTEIFIVEDGSQDNSQEICLQLAASDKRIKLLQHPGKKNRGVSASRNLGIKNAKNNFIAFLDADDYYLPNRFRQTRACFEADESIEGVYEMVGIHSDELLLKPYSLIEEVSPNELFENLQPIGHKVWFHIDGLTVKKSIFEGTGFFNESLKTSEDTFQSFKMASICKLVPGEINNPVALSEQLSTGLSSNRSQVKKDFILMLLNLFRFCNKISVANSKKELVLTKLFFFISNSPNNESYRVLEKLNLFIKVIFTDPGYVLLRSQSFRRYAGDTIGYNRLLHFFKKHNSKGLV